METKCEQQEGPLGDIAGSDALAADVQRTDMARQCIICGHQPDSWMASEHRQTMHAYLAQTVSLQAAF